MDSPLPPIPPIIAQLTGPLLLGHFFNWGLFGALTVQTYIYYLAFPNDRRLPKGIVLFVYVFELLQTILATRDAFRNFGTGWGNMIDLDQVGLLWFSVPVMSAIISCISQLFFAWRIRILSQTIWLPALIIFLALFQAVAGIWTGGYAHVIGIFSQVQVHTENTTVAWLGGTALCDVIIATSMMFYLNKSRTGFRETNVLLAKLVRITVETGLLCATLAILDLSLFLAFKNNNYHLAPSIALSKLYSNSLVAVLNARVRIVNGRNSRAAAHDVSLSLPTSSAFTSKTATYTDQNSRIGTRMGGVISVSVSQHVSDDATELGDATTFSKGSLNHDFPSGQP